MGIGGNFAAEGDFLLNMFESCRKSPAGASDTLSSLSASPFGKSQTPKETGSAQAGLRGSGRIRIPSACGRVLPSTWVIRIRPAQEFLNVVNL